MAIFKMVRSILLAGGVALLASSCCTLKKQAAAIEPRAISLVEKSKTEPFEPNSDAVATVKSDMQSVLAKIENKAAYKPCTQQWTLLQKRVNSYFDRWESSGTPLNPSFVDSARPVIVDAFKNIR